MSEKEVTALYELEKPEEKNDRVVDLNSTAPLIIHENQPIGTIVGEFKATDPDGNNSLLTYQFVSGANDNDLFTLESNGTLRAGTVFDFESNASVYTVRIKVIDEFNATEEKSFSIELLDVFENDSPIDLNSTFPLTIAENQPVGSIVGEFNATDPEGGQLAYQFVSGENDNDLFILESNGTLRAGTVFDFESNASVYTVEVKVRDEHNTTLSGQFSVSLIDDVDDQLKLSISDFSADGKVGALAQLKVHGESDLSFALAPDSKGDIHHFVLEANGSLKLVEDIDKNGTHILNIQAFRGDELVEEDNVTVNIRVPSVEPIMDANTSDPAYHESALMIRELKVVRDNWRNGHNPILNIGPLIGKDGLFVTTAQPHRRQGEIQLFFPGKWT